MKLGASFSHTHLQNLGLNPLKAIKEYKSLNLSWIRLGCYWNEIEKEEGVFDFSQIEPLVKYCEKNYINVVLTVGMKAPRWPEYYFPNWLEKNLHLKKYSKIKINNKKLLDSTLRFIENTVKRFRKNKIIKAWQVENEPLDPVGPNSWRIDEKFLNQEVDLVKKLDPARKIIITAWGNEIGVRRDYPKLAKLADIVGLDFYLKHEFSIQGKFIKYVGPMHSKKSLKKILDQIKKGGKKIWIAELQAEPWEPDEIITKIKNPPSFLPKHFEKNLNYISDLNPEVVLLWGFEFWLLRKQNGDLRYWEKAKEAINEYNNS